MKEKTIFTLHPGIYYRKINDQIFLYHTSQRQIYKFNEISGDIFDCCNGKTSSFDEICDRLEIKYHIDDKEFFLKTVNDFITLSVNEGIIIPVLKSSKYKDILEYEVLELFSNNTQLFSVTMELTYRCNEKCRHCYVYDEGGNELTTEKIIKIIDDLHEMGAFHILFTGGEVFLREDFIKILEYAHSKNFVIDIFTNGTLLNAEKIIKIKSLWPRCIHFSVYSHISEKHDAITQIPGSFEKTIEAIKKCTLLGIQVNIKSPIFEDTKEDVDGIISLAESLGVTIGLTGIIFPKKNGDPSPLEMSIKKEEDLKIVSEIIKDNIESNSKESMDKKDKSGFICNAGQNELNIDPYGKVYPCSQFRLCVGDVFIQSIKDIWKNSPELNKWRDINRNYNRTQCMECDKFEACNYCPGEALGRKADPLSKYEEACKTANLFQRDRKKDQI